MRRITSLFIPLAVVAAGLIFSSRVASAAPGDITTSTGTAVSPAAISGATPSKIVRLPNENAFLAVGRVESTSGSKFHLWKIKSDLTIDSTFGAIDLGNEFAFPTSAESVTPYTDVHSIGSLIVNERLGKYAISFQRALKGTSSSDATVMSIAVGSLSTGAPEAKSVFLSFAEGGSATASNYAAYSTNEFPKDQCTGGTGATVNGAPLSYGYTSGSTLQFRPDGSLFIGLNCDYSNYAQLSPSATGILKTATSQLYVGLKVSGSTIVLDTSFGTAGRTVIADGTSSCPFYMSPINTVDSGITSATSSQPYFVHVKSEYSRTTTLPATYQMMNLSYVTGFSGCDSSYNSSTTYANSLIPITASGTLLTAQSLGTAPNPNIFRWVIDKSGRWNTLFRVTSGIGLNTTTTYTALRLANGVLDTTLGANGQKQVPNLPSTISAGGTNVSIRYSISGIANTATDSYFIGFASASGGSGGCVSSTTVTQNSFAYQLSFDTGLITSYGTSGLSAPGTFSRVEKGFCPGGGNASSSYVDSAGRPGYLVNLAALGSQSAGLVQFRWDAATGVTGGGDGASAVDTAPTRTTTGAPAATNRVDKKVYSTKLPTVVQPDSALTVLTAKQAKSLDIRSTTPKICVALTTSVLLVNPGRCVVQIIDEDTKKVLRSMATTVKKKDVEVGTTLTTDEPIMFKQAKTKLSKQALAQVAELAEAAKDASRVVVIGHSAAIGEVSKYSYAISRDRANAVKAALVKAGVKATIEVVAYSYNQPDATKKNEAAQAKNRRAEVFIFP